MNERKTKGLTNLNSDEKIIRDTCVSLARMYFSQFAAISCLIGKVIQMPSHSQKTRIKSFFDNLRPNHYYG